MAQEKEFPLERLKRSLDSVDKSLKEAAKDPDLANTVKPAKDAVDNLRKKLD